MILKKRYLVNVILILIVSILADKNSIVSANVDKNGLVQLWQEIIPEQEGKESWGNTGTIICKSTNKSVTYNSQKSQLYSLTTHDLYSLEGGSPHQSYVNSLYVDDALYLGEDNQYYYIYLSGFEGKVLKSEEVSVKADLNCDGTKANYQVRLTARFIPQGNNKVIQQSDIAVENEYLDFSNQYLNSSKYDEQSLDTRSSLSVASPSYYTSDNGILIHYLTNNVTKADNYSKVIIGKAPDWMTEKKKYYSYDGIYFYSDWRNIKVNGSGAINSNNPFYNYYQYIPIRSRTNYTSQIIDNYTNNNGGQGGKLVSTGNYFINSQNNFGINAALQYAMGIHESGWGKSSLSINKNNLFGMNAVDSNPYGSGYSFETVEKGIYYHADHYMSRSYTNVIGDYRYFGSHVGNKGSGMNVKYASDPYWGEKIAGWYYRLDSNNQLKDYNYYTIGIKNNYTILDVKKDTSSTSSTLYQTLNNYSKYRIKHYPILIVDQVSDYYKIKLDSPMDKDGEMDNKLKYTWDNMNGYILKNQNIYLSNKGKYVDNGYVGKIDSLKDGQIISGNVSLKGYYLYGKDIERVEFHINGVKQGDIKRVDRTDLSSQYPNYNTRLAGFEGEIDTTKILNGTHTFEVVAIGKDGTRDSQKVKVTVNNQSKPYVGKIELPTTNEVLKGKVTIKGYYLYGKDIERVEFHINGVKQGDIKRVDRTDLSSQYPNYNTRLAGFEGEIDTTKILNGTHTFEVVAIGKDGTRDSQKVKVTVNNQSKPYVGKIELPTTDEVLKGKVTIKGYYLYGKDIERVEFHINGVKQGDIKRVDRTDLSSQYPNYNTRLAGFEGEIDTTKILNGTHTFEVVAIGKDGTRDSQKVKVIVKN